MHGPLSRDFLGLKFFILGFFGIGKFGKYFLRWIDFSGDILGIQNNLKIRRSAPISRPHSSVSKVKPHLVCGCSF